MVDRSAEPWYPTAAYLYVLHLDSLALAWEYLRRHPDYRLDWLRRHRRPQVAQEAAHRWGLRLLEDPALDARDAHPAWLPGHAAVVQLYPDDDPPPDAATFAFWRIPGHKQLIHDGKRLVLAVRWPGRSLRFALAPGLDDGMAVAYVVRADSTASPRYRASSIALAAPAAVALPRPPPAALLELHTLQALDATLAGASLREVAEGLFGVDAVADWYADGGQRSKVRRLVRRAAMTDRRDDDFRIRPSAPKNRGQGFVSKVLKQAEKASSGKSSVRRPAASGSGARAGQRPGSRLGRGHTAARFAGAKLTPMSRRVTIKTLLVNQRQASPQSLAKHLRYIERDGVGRDGEPDQAYGPQTDAADLDAFKERCADDRHHFRFILSPEDGAELEDLRTYTRHLMGRMEADLGTGLDWVAVNHWNTDNPHTHIVVRGRDDTGKDLIIAGDYIADGFRHRAAELATKWLGPRTELGIQQTLQREVEQERWTSLDRTLKRELGDDGLVHVERLNEPRLQRQRLLLIGRLQRLQRLGLADETQPGTWAVHTDAEKTLRALGERGDIIRTMQRAMSGEPRELAEFEPGDNGRTILGRVAAKGLADELRDRGYLVIDGVDGKAHYVALNARDELANYPTGAVVEVKGSADVRAADRNIAALASDGLYRTDHHLAIAQGQAVPGRDPQEVVAAHVRRLEALRRAGIVERVAEGLWKVPGDLPERGRQYDAQRLGGVAVELKSHLPIERQARVIGATWLDQQLIGGGSGLGDLGFGGEAKQAMQQRADFLAEEGLAERRGQRVILARNLLGTLRNRELAQAAKDIATETGLEHRPVSDGQRVAGIYRRSVMLASGRYAILDDWMGFSLVPWKPVIEQRLGQQVAATMRGGGVSWEVGVHRSISIG